MKRFLLIPLLAVAACSSGSTSVPSPKNTVAWLQSGLTAADKAALIYTGLPRCPQPTGTACSVQATVTQIKSGGQTAYDSVTAAQAAVDADPTGAKQATAAAVAAAATDLGAFQALLPKGN